MFSYQTYKMVHYFGFMLLFFGLGGILIPGLAGQKLEGLSRKICFSSHGVGLLLILIGGFGMLARLQLGGVPPWIYAKLGIWTVMGFSLALARRIPSLALIGVLLFIAVLAPYLAIYKPF